MATRKKAAAKAAQGAVVLVKLPGGVEFGCSRPGQDSWDRYLHKLRHGEEIVARREVVQTNCATHDLEGAKKVMDRFPAVISRLSDALDDLLGGDIEPTVDDGAGLVSCDLGDESFVLNAPTLDQWENLQRSMSDRKVRLGPALRDFLAPLCDSSAKLLAALEVYPAAIQPLSGAVGMIAGADFEIVVKKG